jgi:hypothetical protein
LQNSLNQIRLGEIVSDTAGDRTYDGRRVERRDALSIEASPTENDEDVAVLLDYGEGFPASAVEKPLSAVAIRNVPGG